MEQCYKPRPARLISSVICDDEAGLRLSADTRAYAPAALRVQIPVGAPNKYPPTQILGRGYLWCTVRNSNP